MANTITITLTESAQREALKAGQPAQAEQTYEVHQEHLEMLLVLPWTNITKDGEAHCRVPEGISWYQVDLEQPEGSPMSYCGLGSNYDAKATHRPVDDLSAIMHAASVVDGATAQLNVARREYAKQRAEREERYRTHAAAWAALPLEWRTSPGGVCLCVPLSHDGGEYRGRLYACGRKLYDLQVLRQYDPEAVKEAEREVERLRLIAKEEAEERAEKVACAQRTFVNVAQDNLPPNIVRAAHEGRDVAAALESWLGDVVAETEETLASKIGGYLVESYYEHQQRTDVPSAESYALLDALSEQSRRWSTETCGALEVDGKPTIVRVDVSAETRPVWRTGVLIQLRSTIGLKEREVVILSEPPPEPKESGEDDE